ncbi:YDG/SRA domain-containing protein [Micromonospora sp. WMMB235]|uniref:YDG/SRA domain-containing protein n=1 Tax=Micromonospora sp. WMMB235 TaxID=1172030 RepID=UPI0008D9126E|nr:YDG/SRA domain-containing protein [Micromonospora sp. WMMB235]OHX05209.1 SRA-YDG domain-containing protein [Micromonospora sp. WMMB235]
MPKRTYGEIPGFPPGSTFANRTELAKSQVHRPNQGGICGGADGAESIVVSGGYVDDEDYGDEIVYTGQGGNDPSTKRQIADQKLILGNLGLARSQLDGNPVRVIRGAGGDPKHSPTTGLRYDGLFRVVDHWTATGIDGFKIWRYRLVALESADPPPDPIQSDPGKPVSRVETTIQRLVRSTAKAVGVKRLHDYTCQICGVRLITPAGAYAEAAHIRPLGKPHNGPDDADNILCLCPNHHLLFDTGAIYIDSSGQVREIGSNSALGDLRVTSSHPLNWAQFEYHRKHHVSDEKTD